MKISTSLGHAMKVEGVSARESARMMKLAGFDAVDMNLTHDMMDNAKIMTPEWAQKVYDEAEALKAEGLEIGQCHLPYYPGHLPLPGDGSVQTFVDLVAESWAHAIEVAGQVGCPVAVMHPFFDMNADAEVTYEGNVRLIEKLMPAMKKWNVKLALENCYGHNGDYVDGHAARPEDILEILSRCDEEYVGACIDTGHANIFKINIGNMARMYGKRLIALHVNGNAGGDSHCIPYSISGWTEQMDYHDFSAALKEIGYQGTYNLEVDIGNMPKGCGQAYLNFAAAVARGLSDLAE